MSTKKDIAMLSEYPEIKAYIETEPVDLSLLDKAKIQMGGTYLNAMTLFELCCYYDKPSHLKALPLTQDERRELVLANSYRVMLWAAESAHIETIKYLGSYLTTLERKKAVKTRDYEAIRKAISNGHLETLKHLENYLTENERKEAVKSDNYQAIREAVQNGHLKTLKQLESYLTDREIKELVKARHYEVVRKAASNGHLEMFKYLERYLTKNEIKEMVESLNYNVISEIAQNGHLEMFKHLKNHLTKEERKTAVKARDYGAIRKAADNNHLETFKYLENYLTENEKKEIAKAEKYELIYNAAREGHLEIIKHLETYLTENERKEALKERMCGITPFYVAAEKGHFEIIKHLETYLTENERKEAVKSNECNVIYAAVGHLEIFKHLEKYLTTEEEKNKTVKARDYGKIRNASISGDLETLEYLEHYLTDEERTEAVKTFNYYAIIYAASYGHLKIIKHLENYLDEKEKKEAVRSADYIAMWQAAATGHFEILQYLEGHLDKDEIKKAVKASDYRMIIGAATHGRLKMFKYLESYLTEDERKEVVRASNYKAIREAARFAHLETFNYLKNYLTESEINEVVRADHYEVIRNTTSSFIQDSKPFKAKLVVNHLLNIDISLSYAESHDQEYGQRYVYPFVRDKLAILQAQKETFEQLRPNDVFNLGEAESKLCFYMLRNLIRRGVEREYAPGENTTESIRFLLSIPSIRALCHQCINEDVENSLLRLAQRLGNTDVATLLLQLPDVRRLAQMANFYQDDVHGDVDLREIAEDYESSMVALNEVERKAVGRMKSHYQEKLKQQGGVAPIIEKLKADLKARYEKNPATLTITDKLNCQHTITLPFEWEALQALRKNLSDETYQSALKAYFQHDAHTAYRYLSIPNYWTHPEASYVYVFHDNRNQPTPYRYSTFEEYQPLISLFYLAAFDETFPGIDGYTLEGRQDLFIKQLALIGRAHNWDKSRQIVKGKKVILEEYDDFGGDRPSCYSGVNRRLFQSVLGHSLFKNLTPDIIKQALNEQVKDYFDEVITADNSEMLDKAYRAIVYLEEEDLEPHKKVMCSINIPLSQKEQMIESARKQLEKAYPDQFKEQDALITEVLDNHLNSYIESSNDFARFEGLLSLKNILERRMEQKQNKENRTNLTSHSLFSSVDLQAESVQASMLYLANFNR